MKIGIIIHSETGNTHSVAIKIQEKLIETGHLAEIERLVSINGEQSNASKVKFERVPDITRYDALVLGGPVRAFSISPVLAAFLEQIDSLQKKEIGCFVTQSFPYPWMGGNRTISQIKKICESKDGVIRGTGIVNWNSAKREQKISDVVERFSKLFS